MRQDLSRLEKRKYQSVRKTRDFETKNFLSVAVYMLPKDTHHTHTHHMCVIALCVQKAVRLGLRFQRPSQVAWGGALSDDDKVA